MAEREYNEEIQELKMSAEKRKLSKRKRTIEEMIRKRRILFANPEVGKVGQPNEAPEDIEVETLTPIRGSYYGTTYKEIRIVRNGSFITVSLVWLNNPVTRSYDVFAIRLTSGVGINGSVNFRQYSDNNGNGIISTTCSKKTFSNGVGVSFKLSVYNNLESYITFNYTGSGTIYSSYQHATTGVTLTQSKKYTLSSSGYGGTTLFDSSVSSYYDGMSGVNLSV